MKTYKYITTIILVTFFIFGCFFSSCNIGLGPSVDLQAPVVEVTSHKDNDSVAESFVLFGTASDNEVVTNLSIDFEDADIHFKVIPGDKWQKKTSASENWQNIPDDNNNYCTLVDGVWKWSIDVNTKDKKAEKTDTAFSFKVLAEDKIGNTGKTSTAECTLIVDTSNPKVSVYKPELFTGEYSSVLETVTPYELSDGNVIAKLLNGSIELQGHQSDAISFKALRVQFDNGQLQSGVSKVTGGTAVSSIDEIDLNEKSYLGDESAPEIYFSKIVEASDLREWSLTVDPEEWATNDSGKAKGLDAGKHIIRVVTTSLSSSNAWEHKVAGYFVWYPEADKPWIATAVGAESETELNNDTDNKYACYPGSNFSGSAQDDDAIKSFVSSLYKLNEQTGHYEVYSQPKSHTLPAENSKYVAWAVEVPSDAGKYKISLEVQDYTGNTTILTKFFKTSDVSAPKIELKSPLDNSSAIIDAEGNITFKGKISDNSKVAKFSIVHLNPAKKSDPSNKIKYLTGEGSEWDSGTVEGTADINGNIVYKFETGTVPEYSLNKIFNLYSDLGINGTSKLLSAQEFILRAVDDSGTKTVKTLTLTGDSITPEVTYKDITINGNKQNFATGDIPSFPKISNGTKAVITGTWKDYFNTSNENKNKLHKLEISWGDETVLTDLNSNGTWSCEIKAPKSGGTITAKLQDFAGNVKTLQTAVSIETSDLGLSRIDCQQDDGAYNENKELNITLEFTKNTTVDTTGGTPTLTLNNGGTATYISGSGTASHIYRYTVGSSTSEDTEDLTITAINPNGAKWFDSAALTSELELTSEDIPANGNLGDVRTIKIDNTKPGVSSISLISTPGYYGAGKTVLISMNFTEDVSISSYDNLKVKFAHQNAGAEYKDSSNYVMAGTPAVSGTKSIMFTYNIKPGDNAAELTFSGIEAAATSIKDGAGNNISSWTPVTAPSFAGVVIDTTAPAAPGFKNNWNPESIILSESGTEFELISNGDDDSSSQEYSLDNGSNWTPYTGKVTVTNNGTYTVVAKQTDKAGNTSVSSTAKTFIIDKGDLLTRITAQTPNGTYSNNSTTKSVSGKIQFRKSVTIGQGAYVTLNIKNGANTSYKTAVINECKTTSGSGKEFTFTYDISDGDYVDAADKKLDVTGFSFTAVKIDDYNKNYNVSIPTVVSASGKRFNENRDIKIITGLPQIVANGISFTGEGENAVLTVEFNREISKLSGNIVFEYDTNAQNNEFHVPVVLSAAEYNEISVYPAISSNYEKGTNGVVFNEVNSNGTITKTISNDTTVKYVLKEGVSDTEQSIVSVFTGAGKHKVTIPVISDQVEVVTGVNSTQNNTLKISLGDNYKLPVKGAKYKLKISAGVVTDDVKNVNAEYNSSVTAEGVESPVIRIIKPDYKIYKEKKDNPNDLVELSESNWISTASSYVTMSEVQYATMYMNCRTPGHTIKYTLSTHNSNRVTVRDSYPGAQYTNSRNTGNAAIPESADETYNGPISLGSQITNYDTATGLKIVICAQALKDGFNSSELSYEYATRTVLKFLISGNYRTNEGEVYNAEPEGDAFKEKSNQLKLHDMKPWIMGGDSSSGPNSIDDFPLSWIDTGKYQLMDGDYTTEKNMHGQWYWVSWKLSSTAYIGFIIGNVPKDAVDNGPSCWCPADFHWVPVKDRYPLYPGEQLEMAQTSDSVTPMDASLAFSLKKRGHR